MIAQTHVTHETTANTTGTPSAISEISTPPAVEQKQLQPSDAVAIRILRLDSKIQAIASGAVASLLMFIATNWLVVKGGATIGPHLGLLSQYFVGYSVTFEGSLIGAAYAFGFGTVVGYVLTRFYNAIAASREQTCG